MATFRIYFETGKMIETLAYGYSSESKDLPRQESGSHCDSQTPDYSQNVTQLYFVRFSQLNL